MCLCICVSAAVSHIIQAAAAKGRPALVEVPRQTRTQIDIGPCSWIVDRPCPDDDVKFYLFTRKNPRDRQSIHADETWDKSNLSSSNFNPMHPTKIIIHGYNSDMFLTPLIEMKDGEWWAPFERRIMPGWWFRLFSEYLQRGEYNLFYVDWSILAPAPCYPSAAHNTRHAGQCIAQLIERIRDTGTQNIHLIGFSLGAHVTNYAANNLKDFILPRISGDDVIYLQIVNGNFNRILCVCVCDA